MTAITNTYQTYQARGIREDLANVIYDISPEDTPFMSNVGRGTAKNTFFEWQTDTLAAATSANARIEGFDVTSFTQVSPTTRIGNYTQIVSKDLIIAGTTDAVDKAGRKSELAYQMAKRSAELKRDMEVILVGSNQAASAGNATTARTTASLQAFLRTNTDAGVGGGDPAAPNPAPGAGRTDGTQRTFTEDILKTVIRECWESGAEPSILMMGAGNKQRFSTFAGVATKTFYQSAVKVTSIIGAADVYVSDFGQFSAVPNRFMRARDVLLLDPEYASVDYLRPFQTIELAKTGDAEKRLILAEFGLRVKNERAHGIIADLNVS